MTNPNSGNADKGIWSRVTLDQLADAITSLGDRTEQLGDETWRFNTQTRSPSSLWGEVINKIQLDHNEATRHSLYKIWRSNRYKIVELVEQKVSVINRNENDGNDGAFDRTEESSVPESNNKNLIPDSSLPLPQRPNTRTNEKENINDNNTQNRLIGEESFTLTASEWKEVFSHTHQKMKENWTFIFNNKLVSSGVKCAVRFKTPYIKQGLRKQACQFFCCHATCINKLCPRTYRIILRNEPDQNSTALFLVRIYNPQIHDVNIETSARQLRGKERFLVGKKLYYLF